MHASGASNTHTQLRNLRSSAAGAACTWQVESKLWQSCGNGSESFGPYILVIDDNGILLFRGVRVNQLAHLNLRVHFDRRSYKGRLEQFCRIIATRKPESEKHWCNVMQAHMRGVFQRYGRRNVNCASSTTQIRSRQVTSTS